MRTPALVCCLLLLRLEPSGARKRQRAARPTSTSTPPPPLPSAAPGTPGGGEEAQAPELEVPPNVELRPVHRRPWTPDDDVASLLEATDAQPLVLSGTPADGWGIRRWSPATIGAQQLPGVKISQR